MQNDNSVSHISSLGEKLHGDLNGKIAMEHLDKLAGLRRQVQLLQARGLNATLYRQSESLRQAIALAEGVVRQVARLGSA